MEYSNEGCFRLCADMRSASSIDAKLMSAEFQVGQMRGSYIAPNYF
jgi:hypothetical protein